MISGSLASIFYGEPRLTMDVDIVVHLETAEANDLSEYFPAADFYVPPPEVMAAELARPTRGHSEGSGLSRTMRLIGIEALPSTPLSGSIRVIRG